MLSHCERSEAISTREIAPDCFVVPPRNDCLRKLEMVNLDSSSFVPSFPKEGLVAKTNRTFKERQMVGLFLDEHLASIHTIPNIEAKASTPK